MATRCERCSYRNPDDADHCARCESPLVPVVNFPEVIMPAPVLMEAVTETEEQPPTEQ